MSDSDISIRSPALSVSSQEHLDRSNEQGKKSAGKPSSNEVAAKKNDKTNDPTVDKDDAGRSRMRFQQCGNAVITEQSRFVAGRRRPMARSRRQALREGRDPMPLSKDWILLKQVQALRIEEYRARKARRQNDASERWAAVESLFLDDDLDDYKPYTNYTDNASFDNPAGSSSNPADNNTYEGAVEAFYAKHPYLRETYSSAAASSTPAPILPAPIAPTPGYPAALPAPSRPPPPRPDMHRGLASRSTSEQTADELFVPYERRPHHRHRSRLNDDDVMSDVYSEDFLDIDADSDAHGKAAAGNKKASNNNNNNNNNDDDDDDDDLDDASRKLVAALRPTAAGHQRRVNRTDGRGSRGSASRQAGAWRGASGLHGTMPNRRSTRERMRFFGGSADAAGDDRDDHYDDDDDDDDDDVVRGQHDDGRCHGWGHGHHNGGGGGGGPGESVAVARLVPAAARLTRANLAALRLGGDGAAAAAATKGPRMRRGRRGGDAAAAAAAVAARGQGGGGGGGGDGAGRGGGAGKGRVAGGVDGETESEAEADGEESDGDEEDDEDGVAEDGEDFDDGLSGSTLVAAGWGPEASEY